MPNLVGKTLKDRYNVQEFLGRGGMAEVYKVWDSHRMTYLAMKVILEDMAVDKVFMRRFAREAHTLEKLQHPSIVRFYGLEREGRLAFMLMDYIEGDNLKPIIFDQGGPLPQEQVRSIMRSICGALSYAHRQGMVHCDIKSANIMLNKHGEAMLTDFGIARMTDAATATMVGAGTPAYMAPEQVRGQDPTPQSDIYGLGVVLYEMLTGGERPFTGENASITGSTSEKLRWEQMNTKPTPPRKWNKNISPELEAVILKCLEKDGRNRYQSALDLFNALELAFGGAEKCLKPEPVPFVETPSPPKAKLPPRQPTKQKKRNRKIQQRSKKRTKIKLANISIFLGGGVIVLLLIIYLAGKSPSSPTLKATTIQPSTTEISATYTKKPQANESPTETQILSAKEKIYASAPEMTIDTEAVYFAIVNMTDGGIFIIKLYPDKAPITVNNFVFLVREGFFDGTTFHRVLEGFMAQGGDPTGTGMGGPGYQFVNEDSNLTFDQDGVVAMANAGRDTNGSQFFITFAPAPQLNGGYTIFGQVVKGMDVVNGITRRDPQQSPDPEGDKIEKITIRKE